MQIETRFSKAEVEALRVLHELAARRLELIKQEYPWDVHRASLSDEVYQHILREITKIHANATGVQIVFDSAKIKEEMKQILEDVKLIDQTVIDLLTS